MVRYAQNCPLPCNPTVEESIRYQKEYKLAKDLVMLSEDKLKMRMKSFLSNHLSQLIPMYSLLSKGPQSKIFQLENKRNKLILSERKNGLQKICSYFKQNDDFLKDLESDLKINFQKQIQQIFEKFKSSLQDTLDTYQMVVKKQIQSIRLQIRQNLLNIQKEMKKYPADQIQSTVQTINGKLTNTQISKFFNISLEQVKGYSTIFKIIEKRSSLIRKIGILQENFNENDDFSCDKQIEGLTINCSLVSCGDMWSAIQLMKKKRDFNTSFSSHQNSFSSLQNSFTSFQSPVSQNSFATISNERQTRELNPEVQFNQQDLVVHYENSLKSIEERIINKLYGILHNQRSLMDAENQQDYSESNQYKNQPLGFYINENELHRILYKSKQMIKFQFQKLDQKNKFSNFSFSENNQKNYYEPLDSSSQNQQSYYEEERNTNEIRANPNVTIQKIETFNIQRGIKSKEQQNKNSQIQVSNMIQSSSNQNVVQIQKSSTIFTFAGQNSQIKEQFETQNIRQETIQIMQRSNETQMNENDQDESRIHYASESQDESDTQKEKQIDQQKQQQDRIPSFRIEKQQQYQDQKSSAQQYSQYIRKMREKDSKLERQEQIQEKKHNGKQIYKKQIYQQEEKIYNDYQKKLDQEQGWNKQNSRPIYEKDPSLMGDSRLRSDIDENSRYESQNNISNRSNRLHNFNNQEESINQPSLIEKDPEMKRIAQEWKNSRRKEIYKHVSEQQQNQQELLQYVSYDYEPENERERPYQGRQPVQDQFLYPPEQNMSNILPEEISRYHDIEEQRRIYEQIERKKNSFNQSRQGNRVLKKLGNVMNEVVIPGFYAFKKHKQLQNYQELRKAKQLEQFQNSMLQIALDESREFSSQNQNNSLKINMISEIKPNSPFQSNPRPKFQLPKTGSKRQIEDNFEQDFTQFQEFFRGLSTIKSPFSLQENSGFNFLDDDEQDIMRPIARRRLNDEMRIQDIKLRQEELDISKQEFSIVVKVLKPVLLTFKSMDKRQNSPMAKFIVGDETGIAVLYMKYYCDIKPGSCLKLNRCRVCKYRSSYEITNMSRISTANVLTGSFIPQIKYSNHLSLIRGSSINQLSYEVRPDFNDLLRDCVRDMLKNGNQRQQLIRKPLIVTVCDANLSMKRYLLGDYTGRIVAEMGNCNQLLAKHETVLIKNIRICIRGDKILLVGQRNTVILKADFDWKFKHDLQYIPNEQFKVK